MWLGNLSCVLAKFSESETSILNYIVKADFVSEFMFLGRAKYLHYKYYFDSLRT